MESSTTTALNINHSLQSLLQFTNNKKEDQTNITNIISFIESTSQVDEPGVEVPESEIKVIAKSEEAGGIV